MHGHALSKGSDLFREFVTGFRAEAFHPFGERSSYGIEQPADFVGFESLR